ncbi:MAG: hypothetical protein ACFE9C_08360 [Candidatus Hodarchaeota archaeon]
MTSSDSYYDWELKVRTKPPHLKEKKKTKKIYNDLGLSVKDFKRYVKLWRSKNIIF